jgi:hypothetical protein
LAITFQFDHNAGILRTTAEGVVNYDELYNHLIEERQAMGLSLPEIVDARTASFEVTDGEARSLMWLLRSWSEMNDMGPTAVIVGNPVAWGVIRMMGAIAGDSMPTAPFWTNEEAEAWITHPPDRS